MLLLLCRFGLVVMLGTVTTTASFTAVPTTTVVSPTTPMGISRRRSAGATTPRTTTTTNCIILLQAKKTKNKKKSASTTAGGGGVKGFGAAVRVSNNKKNAVVELDTAPETRAFYEHFLEPRGGGPPNNLKRTALGYYYESAGDGVRLRGVIATRDISKGSDIIDIPYELALDLGPEGDDPTVPAVEFLRDYCRVFNDDDDDNPKKHYYRMLPPYQGSDCQGSTDCFSPEALEALQSPLIVEETARRRARTADRFHSEFDDNADDVMWIDGSTPVTQDHLQWAVWLITSRVLTVQGGDEGAAPQHRRLLIPYLDMCNHDRRSPHVLTGRAVPGGKLRVVAGATVPAGTAVHICYGGGVAGNDRFVQDYGFLDDHDEGYALVAQELLGKRRIREGSRMGQTVSEADRERSLAALRATTMAQDQEALERETDRQIRTAIQYRLGVKKALSKFIVMA